MRIAVGCDPNAAAMKYALADLARSLGHEVTDLGSDDPVYANVAIAVATAVAAGRFDRGVVMCGTGLGVSIAANKVPGCYCALVTDVYQAQRATLSNNANVVAFGAQVTGIELAKALLTEFLAHTYDPESRSAPKVARIAEFERTGA
ncbi:MAG: RpiB/LacA/LacB family sugar-phosphate isomerase [Propionibacteriaceae bacterium]|jgi:ribose 5-phosphate isomerase B|nr:RpiB/LacA/LacB family sugar-phosphate isomerase [Propionibacteriaceae bacterium]